MALRRVLLTTPGGDPGSSGMTDSIALAARVFLGDSNVEPADALLSALQAKYADATAAQEEGLRIGVGQSDEVATPADAVLTALQASYAESNLSPADAMALGVGAAELSAGQTEAARLGFTQADANAAQADAGKVGVTQADSTVTPTDAATQALRAEYGESVSIPAEALRLGTVLNDTDAAQADAAKVGITQADSNAAESDASLLGLRGLGETNLAASELLKTGFKGSGLAESSAAPTEGRTATVFTYATTQVSAGNGATDGANTIGQNDGTNGRVRTRTLGQSTCSITPKIPRASIPNAGTYTLFAWYKTTLGAPTGTITLTYTDTGGNPATLTLPQGDYSVTPYSAALAALHATNDITVLFQSTDSVAGVSPSTIDIDAIAIRTANAF